MALLLLFLVAVLAVWLWRERRRRRAVLLPPASRDEGLGIFSRPR
jgi:hypothetical protein